MSGLGTELAPEILAACQAGADEACQALGRCFDGTFTLKPEETTALRATEVPSQWHGAGLALVLCVQGEGAVVFIPESSGLLPAWYGSPDATGTSKLTTLAQELGMVLLPEAAMPDDFAAGRVADFPLSLTANGGDDHCGIPLELSSGGKTGSALLLWPIAQPKQFLTPPPPADVKSPAATTGAAGDPPRIIRPQPRDIEEALPSMPPYIRSLLRIEVTVAVTLAQTQQPVRRILDLAPGSIIQFDKSCEEPLELRVGDTCIAVGEAVKSGEKYGVRLTSMILPEERFTPLGHKRQAG